MCPDVSIIDVRERNVPPWGPFSPAHTHVHGLTHSHRHVGTHAGLLILLTEPMLWTRSRAAGRGNTSSASVTTRPPVSFFTASHSEHRATAACPPPPALPLQQLKPWGSKTVYPSSMAHVDDGRDRSGVCGIPPDMFEPESDPEQDVSPDEAVEELQCFSPNFIINVSAAGLMDVCRPKR